MRYHKQIEEIRNGDICGWYSELLSETEVAILMQSVQDCLKPPEGMAVIAIAIDLRVEILATKRPPIDTKSPKSRLAMLLNAVKDECVKMADYGSAADALALVEKIRKETP